MRAANGLLIGLTFLGAMVLPRPAWGDVVRLRTGGEIRGELQVDARANSQGDDVTIRTLTGAVVKVAKSEVGQIVRRRLAIEEYEPRRRSADDSVAGQWELAEWCRLNLLPRERRVHLARVVELDPEHIQAHRALGHVREPGRGKGQWKTQDELMASRGYVKHKGKYLLPQELELLEQQERETEAEKDWFRKVRLWRAWIDGNKPERQAEGLKNLKAIDDPNAIRALVRTFRDDAIEARRILYVEIVSKMRDDRTLAPLVYSALQDESQFVRDAAIDGIRRGDVAKALPQLLKGLKNDLNVIVNRAATALGQLGDDGVIPKLIDALVTKHRYRYMVPDGQSISVSTDGQFVQPGYPVLPPEIEGMLRTGQLPYGVIIVEQPMPGAEARKKPVIVQRTEENPSVLTALNRLTGEHFGYDKKSWRRWHTAQQTNDAPPGAAKSKKKAGASSAGSSRGST